MNDQCATDAVADFSAILNALFQNREKASLIIDDNGWERAEGVIHVLQVKEPGAHLVLDNGATIYISTIVAVNGIFKIGSTC